MDIFANVIAKSVSPAGIEITTVETQHPRFVLAEVNTHRVFTRNGASSRAVPFKKVVESIRDNTARPLQWLINQPGMVATNVMDPNLACECDEIWHQARESAIHYAAKLNDRNASKQYVNRLLEPFLMTRTLITSTKWDNFFKLRIDGAAQPEFYATACAIKAAIEAAEAEQRFAFDGVDADRWHLPFITSDERYNDLNYGRYEGLDDDVKEMFNGVPWIDQRVVPLLIMSAARCARLSYRLVDGKPTTWEKDLQTFLKLATDPLHASPMEHQALPMGEIQNPESRQFGVYSGNFHGWRQFRKYLPNEAVDEAIAA